MGGGGWREKRRDGGNPQLNTGEREIEIRGGQRGRGKIQRDRERGGGREKEIGGRGEGKERGDVGRGVEMMWEMMMEIKREKNNDCFRKIYGYKRDGEY